MWIINLMLFNEFVFIKLEFTQKTGASLRGQIEKSSDNCIVNLRWLKGIFRIYHPLVNGEHSSSF